MSLRKEKQVTLTGQEKFNSLWNYIKNFLKNNDVPENSKLIEANYFYGTFVNSKIFGFFISVPMEMSELISDLAGYIDVISMMEGFSQDLIRKGNKYYLCIYDDQQIHPSCIKSLNFFTGPSLFKN